MTDHCSYCWREAENFTKGNPDEGKIPVCAYHFLKFAHEDSEDTFAEKMGFDSAEQVREQYEQTEEPTITITEAIGLINHHTDPRGSARNDKDPVVYTEKIKQKLREKVEGVEA